MEKNFRFIDEMNNFQLEFVAVKEGINQNMV